MPRVTFQPGGEVAEVPEEASVFEAATIAGVTEVSCCGITAACGRCRAVILDGEANVAPPGAFEAEHLKLRRFLPGERFGCMTHVLGDIEVEVFE
jgi:uncharacterized 2Fe-2S/4Fe-4S cluster protein (DUF4445 family)